MQLGFTEIQNKQDIGETLLQFVKQGIPIK